MKTQTKRELLICIMVVAVAARLIGFGEYPGGLTVDEAYAGYEAWSLLNYGMDSWGYSFPVYLTTWGSGMSALNSYLMIPFIAVGGLNKVTMRMPQVLIGILTVYVFYLFVKEISDEKKALISAALLAISPWHVITTRYGMDANMAPGLLVFSAYFFLKALSNKKYMIPSAILYGMSLYTYATIWIFVPVLLWGWGLYALKHKKIKIGKELVLAIVILAVTALPLMLFVLINIGVIPEIRTKFLSIPKLVVFRGDELAPDSVLWNAKSLIKLCLTQNDGLIWNVIPGYGVFYLISLPFGMIGAWRYIVLSYRNLKSRTFGYEGMILFWIIVSIGTGIAQGVNVNKINSIHIPILILIVEGIAYLTDNMKRTGGYVIAALYLLCFAGFEVEYYTDYQQEISALMLEGAGEALEFAMDLYSEQDYEAVFLPNELRHSQVLFYTKWPTDEFVEKVQWQSYPERWLKADSFGMFRWRREEGSIRLSDENIYVFTKKEADLFEENGYQIKMFDNCGVAYIE